MANTFFDPGDQRAAKVHELFSRIAPRYDLINDLQSFGLHRHWKRRVSELARPQPGQRALDLCCGTGDLALGLARRGVAGRLAWISASACWKGRRRGHPESEAEGPEVAARTRITRAALRLRRCPAHSVCG